MTAAAHVDAGRTERAAQRKAARFAETLEGRVLAAVIQAGERGLTALEAREALGLPVERHYSVAPRLSALKGKKLVEPTTVARDNFQAYVATPAGRARAGGGMSAEVLAQATHIPCCSSHGVPMTCARYRRTHFVEVGYCCARDERRDPVADALLGLLNGASPAPRPERRLPEHLRTDDMPSYLRQKGELA